MVFYTPLVAHQTMSLLRYICDFRDKNFLSLVHHMPLPTIQGWTILDFSISVTQFPSVISGKSLSLVHGGFSFCKSQRRVWEKLELRVVVYMTNLVGMLEQCRCLIWDGWSWGQVLNDKGYDGAVADIWSCGVILYVLMAGFLPFDETDLLTLYRKVGSLLYFVIHHALL